MFRVPASLPSLVRRCGLAFAIGLSALLAGVVRAGEPLDDFEYVFACSHDGYEAVGSADFDSFGQVEVADLRYWKYDPTSGTGTVIPFPSSTPADGQVASSVLLPKNGVRLVYFYTFSFSPTYTTTTYVWDVDAETVTLVGSDMFVSCCSDNGETAYCVASDSKEMYRYELSGNVPIPLGAGTFDAPSSVANLVCSADGSICYGIVDDPRPAQSGEHLFVYDHSGPALTYERVPGMNPSAYGVRCSPDGLTAAAGASDGDAGFVLFANPDLDFEEIPVPDADSLSRTFYQNTFVSNAGAAIGLASSSAKEYLTVADRATGEVIDASLAPDTVFVRDLVAASDASRCVYSAFDSAARIGTFRFTRATGVSTDSRNVYEEPDLTQVFAGSSDTTRAYGLVGDAVEFLEQQDFSRPQVTSAKIAADGRTLTLGFTEKVNHGKDSPTLDLTDGVVGAIYLGGDGTRAIQYTLDSFIGEHETGTYALPEGGVEDLTGNPCVTNLGDVVNNSDIDLFPPTVESASISKDGETLTLVFSESVLDITPPTLDLSGPFVAATYESGNGTGALKYSLSRQVLKNEIGTFALALAAVVDASSGNPNDPDSGTIDNDSTYDPDVTPPTVKSAKINAAGDTLTIVYSENVDAQKDATLALSGGAVAVDYESGDGSKAIAYSLSRVVTKGETGTCALVLGAVVDTEGNKIVAVSAKVTNESKVAAPSPDPPKKTEKRPNGATANSMIDVAFQQSYGIFGGAYTDNGYYAFLFAYYSVVYRYECGDSFTYGGAGGPSRSKALDAYKDDRYNQLLYAYYAQYYAYQEYSTTGSSASLYTFLYAYYSYLYAVEDLNAK